ncbi:hypothetical protein NNO95_14695 [Acinetobacter baumannii]|uniref:hypothetical protein n=1 Tax=Acinetobacter baumannii TaxID=470 RepID=UPI0007073502|nr:hypothetical protein [Acinetobacter baumannii]HCT3321426.1 hypothetical protein [Acinetobacter nosocomialis]KQG96400.1 hypothetical protein APC57_07555 [Acinetobacter baumannii]MCQ1055562.1 hypothetical protein [Acinetobacter baumannii]MDV7422480.1 hypothetical protein [Acinetobacter baumannii]MDV7422491.1 hypothetical protein [Acinetobacter baumannii]
MASLYSMAHITYDPIEGYFYKGKPISEKKAKELKHKIILVELAFKADEDFDLSVEAKVLFLQLIHDASIYNDLRDQRAIVYKRYKRLVEYIFQNYEIKPIKSKA